MPPRSHLIVATLSCWSASHVSAQNILGPDALEFVVTSILEQCPAAASVMYLGTGSGLAEAAMANAPPKQQIAPMSRKVRCSLLTQFPASQGKVLGYDSFAIGRSECTSSSDACSAFSASPGPALPGDYTWRGGLDNGPYGVACDMLRVLYFGRNHDNVTDCNSPLRNALVDSWDSVFEGPGSGTCTSLRHAFRPSDDSNATNILRTTCAVPSVQLFCNGNSCQDNDPIRRPADPAHYDVAGANGTLGVVLPVVIPSLVSASVVTPAPYSPGSPSSDMCTSASAGTTRCSSGVFKFRQKPTLNGPCPDGRPGFLCRVPVVSSTGSANCINSAANIPAGAVLPMDGRVYNNLLRKDDGSIVRSTATLCALPIYRMHETRSNFGNGCKQLAAPQQLACLIAAEGCSEGYQREALETQQGVRTIQVADTSPTPACISRTSANVVSKAYPFTQTLYLSTLKGFANVTGGEAGLSACFSNEGMLEQAMLANGFSVDPSEGIQVEDFTASNCF